MIQYELLGFWKLVLSVKLDFDKCARYCANNGQHIKFWEDNRCVESSLKLQFSAVFWPNRVQGVFISNHHQLLGGKIVWVIQCRRNL